MNKFVLAVALGVFAHSAAAQSTEPEEKENVPVMDIQQVATDAVSTSSVIGVTFPLTVISWGSIIAAPATP